KSLYLYSESYIIRIVIEGFFRLRRE
ncbi:hypothetical protein ACN38_g6020, partial [Penicillium nordicum]